MGKYWLIASLLGAGCTGGVQDGTYTVAKSTSTCSILGAKTITFAAGAVTLSYATGFPMQSSSTSDVVFNGDMVTFMASVSARNSDTFDGSSGTEHYALTADGSSVSGTVDGTYSETYNGQPSSCMSSFDLTATRS